MPRMYGLPWTGGTNPSVTLSCLWHPQWGTRHERVQSKPHNYGVLTAVQYPPVLHVNLIPSRAGLKPCVLCKHWD